MEYKALKQRTQSTPFHFKNAHIEKTCKKVLKVWRRDNQLYLLALPAIVYIFIFNYVPLYGLQIAFRRFISVKGIWGSPWIGFENFERFFSSPQFTTILSNTLILSFYGLLAGFPLPIIFALLLNQTRNAKFKKTVQTIVYIPHFISLVVMCGMLTMFLSPSTGIVNNILELLGLEPIYFMGDPKLFPHIYVWSSVWQNTGWGTVIYIAALSSINPEHYEAAKLDGASKLQTIWYIDLPGIKPTIITLLILNIGNIMGVGFQKAFLLQNPLNLPTSEIIATYTYKMGLLNGQFDYGAAIGLFNNVINAILLILANRISRKLSETSLW